jgi:hypothetical protein
VINGALVTLVKAGRAAITASQAGNADYNAAVPQTQSFCINPVRPVISVTNLNLTSPTLTSSSASGNQWYRNGTAIAGATATTFVATESGSYTVQVQIDDCVSQFSEDQPIAITDVLSSEELLVYPNPVENDLVISGIEQNAEIQLHDAVGRMFSLPLERQGDDYHASMREFPAGLYLLRIDQDGRIKTLKVIKK